MLDWINKNSHWLARIYYAGAILYAIWSFIYGLTSIFFVISILIIIIIPPIFYIIYKKRKKREARRKAERNKLEREVYGILELTDPIINSQNYDEKYLIEMQNLLIEVAEKGDILDHRKKSIALLPQFKTGIKPAITCLTGLLENRSTNLEIRRAAAYTLKNFDSDDALKALSKALDDPEPKVIEAAANGLGEKASGGEVFWGLLKVLFKNTSNSPVLRAVMNAIDKICERTPHIEIVEAMKCLIDPGNDPYVMDYALDIIGKIGGAAAVQAFVSLKKRWEPFKTHAVYSKIDQMLNEIGEKGLIWTG
ncbi:MAG: HEAT repeat domain-containing protein [Deltaproteobacteria bacterium]|nr:HEAT repeat domain-containing protein [Deltaproteobacteria bacterium]